MGWDDAKTAWSRSEPRRLAAGKLLLFGALFWIGAISLVTGDFAYSWQPVPPGIPGRPILARLLGLSLMLGSAIALRKRTPRLFTILLGVVLVAWLVVLQGFRLATAPLLAGVWSSFAEIGTLVIATWLLAMRSETPPRIWRIYGVFPCLFGIAHFVFAEITAGLVPGWIPQPLFWAYATGTIHILGGLMIVVGVFPEIAAASLGLMYLSWVLVLHVPRVFDAPGSRFEWTMLFFAAAIAGSALVMSSARAFGTKRTFARSTGAAF